MRGHWCRCCGLGLAFGNFSGVHSVWNFYSVHAHADWIEDNDGWLISQTSSQALGFEPAYGRVGTEQHRPWAGFSSLPVGFFPQLLRFFYKVDAVAERVRIKIRMKTHAPFLLAWYWEVEYELTFDDYDKLLADGRLRLNDYEVSATHSGHPIASTGFVNPGFTATTTRDGWGDIMLVYPKFGEDWSNKKLRVTAATDTPVSGLVNLSWLVGVDHDFVFDDTTYVGSVINLSTTDSRPRYYEQTLSGDGFTSFKARHYSIVDNIANGPAGTQGATTPPEAYPRFALELSFATAATYNGQPIDSQIRMAWQISHIWWKAFENDGVVVTTEHGSPLWDFRPPFPGPPATPVLYKTPTLGAVTAAMGHASRTSGQGNPDGPTSITYTLSVLPLS